ncbi:MAG TPA: hypothetical protein VGC92_01395 [Phenylobacterium sp.]
MKIKFQDISTRTYEAPIESPEDPTCRAAALGELVARGAKFPGNAAGFHIVRHEYEPLPLNQDVRCGGVPVRHAVRVWSEGLSLASGQKGPCYSSLLYVYDGPAQERR